MPNTGAVQPYNYWVVRQFAIMTVVWGVVGMSVGLLVASQLVWPALNFDLPWTSFGRLRPMHTSLVIFGFAGSVQFAASYSPRALLINEKTRREAGFFHLLAEGQSAHTVSGLFRTFPQTLVLTGHTAYYLSIAVRTKTLASEQKCGNKCGNKLLAE
ncbi:MAG: cbb3-type cytochrome c oxidase subunit I [Halopseudomonas sp.]|uniref:cbb3-type cytochrome c oxidase subunit I n=1 Tax=Halopseudomonas sp. TaxID=2901191 RepID=UPI0030022D26